jgi:hypothetical protein
MKTFFAKRISRSHRITLNDEPGKVFSLFTPEEEKKWAPGWNFTLLYPLSGKIEKNLMFITTDHDDADEQAIWIICNYKPLNYCIDYLRIEPGKKVGKIEIVCDDAGDCKTFAGITYTYTSLSEEGNHFIESFTEDYYHQYISHWEKAINYYLKTGKMISD